MDHISFDNLQTNIIGVENLINAINSVESIKKAVFTSSLLVCKTDTYQKAILIIVHQIIVMRAK